MIVKKAFVNEIPAILDSAYSKGTSEKPYTVLFVSEMDDTIRDITKSWTESHKTFSNNWAYYYKEENGAYIPTANYGFDSSIVGCDVVYRYFEIGYGKDTNYKAIEHNVYNDLIHKQGIVVDNDLRLVVYAALYPQWNNNRSLFMEEDYHLFDEVVHLQLNKDIFKTYFENDYNDMITNCNDNDDEDKKDKARLIFQKNIGLFILNHPKFDFIPYGSDGIHFSPVNFYSLISFGTTKAEIINELKSETFNICDVAKKMLLEIVNEYQE